MNRAQKIAAEPQMGDILASIKRAIGGEETLVSDYRPSVDETRSRSSSSRGRPLNEDGRSVAVLPSGVDRLHFARDNDRDTRSITSQEIERLRNKIARELTVHDTPPQFDSLSILPSEEETVDVPEPMQTPSQARPVSLFRSLLGGADESDESLFEPTSHPASPQPPLRGTLRDEGPAYLRPVKKPVERAVPLNVVSVREKGAETLRSPYDQPKSQSPGMRPPFGQSSMGIHAFSPDSQAGEQGLMSAETQVSAEGAFGHLAEELYGRENRQADEQSDQQSMTQVAKELLRPMLKQWIDRFLPGLVEDLVREEIERVSRRGQR